MWITSIPYGSKEKIGYRPASVMRILAIPNRRDLGKK
jgi:hypothetical protein